MSSSSEEASSDKAFFHEPPLPPSPSLVKVPLTSIPDELFLFGILPYLDPPSLIRGIGLTSSRFRTLCISDTLWIQFKDSLFCQQPTIPIPNPTTKEEEEGVEPEEEEEEEEEDHDDDVNIYEKYVEVVTNAKRFITKYYGCSLRKKARCAYGLLFTLFLSFWIICAISLIVAIVIGGFGSKLGNVGSIVALIMGIILASLLVLVIGLFCCVGDVWSSRAQKIGEEMRRYGFSGYWVPKNIEFDDTHLQMIEDDEFMDTLDYDWVKGTRFADPFADPLGPHDAAELDPWTREDEAGFGSLKGNTDLKLKMLSILEMARGRREFRVQKRISFWHYQFLLCSVAMCPVAVIAAILYAPIRSFASTKVGFGPSYFVGVLVISILGLVAMLVKSLVTVSPEDRTLPFILFGLGLGLAVGMVFMMIPLSLVVEGIIPVAYVPLGLIPLFFVICCGLIGWIYVCLLSPMMMMWLRSAMVLQYSMLIGFWVSPFCWCCCCTGFIVLVSLVFAGVVSFDPFFAYLPGIVLFLLICVMSSLAAATDCCNRVNQFVPPEMELVTTHRFGDDGPAEVRRVPEPAPNYRGAVK